MRLSSEILKVVLVSSLILMLSCGKKSGRGTGGCYGPNCNRPGYYGPGGYTGYGGGTIQSYIDAFPCPPTEQRFEAIFNIQGISYNGSFNKTNIQGNLQRGLVSGAAVTGNFIGKSFRNDLVIIEKISAGTNVTGFNVRLLLCSLNNSGVYVLNSERVNLQQTIAVLGALQSNGYNYSHFPIPMVVTENTGCPVGGVDSATITLLLPQYGYLQQKSYPISFTSPGCR